MITKDGLQAMGKAPKDQPSNIPPAIVCWQGANLPKK
jgi:hypothetical protein